MDPLGRSFAARYWALVREAVLTLLVAMALVVVLAEVFVRVYGGVLTWFGMIFAVSAAASAFGLGLLAARSRREHSHVIRVAWVSLVGLVAAIVSVGGMMGFAAPGGWESAKLAMMIQGFSSLIIFGAMVVVAAAWHGWSALKEQQPPFERHPD
ncbi:hypothetical protein [Brevibacterium casei]|uniref:Uncharacterized protein n=1 Tax=Brevibacterium casei TaxID=33889 RepID=A0AB34XUK8_9MICO|nr:hypothetical protein [Brevibacterium casei]KZE22862.1 hypothetical protein AVW13_05660 [Brevibacterium casei]